MVKGIKIDILKYHIHVFTVINSNILKVKVKVKQSPYRPGQALRIFRR